MKKTYKLILSFSALMLAICNFCTASYLDSPNNYSVYQRNGNSFQSTATITFSGTLANSSNAQYQIEKLDQFGAFKSMLYTYRPLSTNTSDLVVQYIPNANGYESYNFDFKISIQTGWYRVTIKDGDNTTFSRKFGVGEVFVIAGQSNAQGEGFAQNIGTEKNYDCVVSAKGGLGNYGESNINYGVINGNGIYMGTIHSDGKIFPNSSRAWFYQELGNKIASSNSNPPSQSLSDVIPVAFFNCALSGSSVQEWKESLDRVRQIHNNSYSNPLISGWSSEGTHFAPWGQERTLSAPYFGLQTVLSYCANKYGIRAVLWHQGEAETKMRLSKLYSNSNISPKVKYYNVKWVNNEQDFSYYNNYDINSYDANLNALIADTRSILGSELVWAIGKVSLTSEAYNGDNVVEGRNVTTSKHTDIIFSQNELDIPYFFNDPVRNKKVSIGNSVIQEQQNVVTGNTNVVWASEGSDNIKSDKRSDQVHFNAVGLAEIATDYYNHMPGILSKTPIPSRTMPRISYTQNGSQYLLSLISGYSQVYHAWGGSFYRDSPNQASTLTINNGFTGFAYSKDNSGRIYISNQVRVGNLAYNSRKKLSDIKDVVAYPNPVQNGETLTLSIETAQSDMVKILVTDESGKLLDEIPNHEVKAGKWKYEIKMPKLNVVREHKVIYAIVVKNNSKNTVRIIVKP
jgi:hypothetical protein